MWLNKDHYLINLNEVFRVRGCINDGDHEDESQYGVMIEFKNNSSESYRWTKFFFETEQERDEYIDQIGELLEVTEIEPDILGKLK